MQARIVESSFEPGNSQTVVREKENDCIAGQAVGFELAEQLTDLLVHKGYQIVIACPDFPHKLRIGIVWRQRDFSRIVPFVRFEFRAVRSIKFLIGTVDLSLVCGNEVKHTEERLTGPAFAPVGLMTRFVPDVDIDKVVVLLVIVRAVVSRRPEIFGEALYLFRQFYLGAQMLGPK